MENLIFNLFTYFQAGVTVADVIMQGHHLDEVGFVCLNPSGAMSLMHALDAR